MKTNIKRDSRNSIVIGNKSRFPLNFMNSKILESNKITEKEKINSLRLIQYMKKKERIAFLSLI